MGSYEEQLSLLKTHIGQLQEDFGEFENLNELHDMVSKIVQLKNIICFTKLLIKWITINVKVNQQRAKLLEATRQNGELAEALQKKDMELERHIESLTEQEQILEQRNGVIKMLSEKDEEQTNIIKLLRTNLEMRTQADMDVSSIKEVYKIVYWLLTLSLLDRNKILVIVLFKMKPLIRNIKFFGLVLRLS